MGRTWPNLDAVRVDVAGYYWNEKLRKLARLQIGEKLPKHPGHWEFVARDGEASSSEVARKIFDRYPGLDVNDFTFTTTSPLDRRLPIGDHPANIALRVLGALGLIAAGVAIGRAMRR